MGLIALTWSTDSLYDAAQDKHLPIEREEPG